jgi:hypothetical protein
MQTAERLDSWNIIKCSPKANGWEVLPGRPYVYLTISRILTYMPNAVKVCIPLEVSGHEELNEF